MKRPHLSTMGSEDLERYRKFADYMIVRCHDDDLIYWADEAEAIATEQRGRQATQALSNIKYSLTRT
jgi:endogenous inhibitor of DNA gyrase (YacG/DUF329 family)